MSKEHRNAIIRELFASKHGREPRGTYEELLLRILVDLREVYDENFDLMRVARSKTGNESEIKRLSHREKELNNLSINLRRALSIALLGAPPKKKVCKYE